ncbi:MAG: LptF/LptG family permease [Sedimentisphaerales bacterium]|jgi:lipopolysaccharide export LptBFGC system permease protein LptF
MKILDKYVAKNFLIGYAIAFAVLIGMRITIDLFANLDEFTEHANLNTLSVITNIIIYYSLQSTLYFRDFAGMITVVAAAFSLGKMVRYNELIAMMASGVSLKRVITPIVVLAIVFSGFLIIDQELVIPALSAKLVRNKDVVPGKESYNVWFITDASGSLLSAKKFDVASSTFDDLIVVTRSKKPDALLWEPTGFIEASKAIYDFKSQTWLLTNGFFTPIPKLGSPQPGRQNASASRTPLSTYHTDLTPNDIPVRRKAEHKSLLSSMQLSQLASQGTQLKDLANLYSQKHFRITDPIMNLVMLLVCLPVLVCRDPKSMKSAIAISFAITAASLVVGFTCRILATEDVFGRIVPELWAWLPVFIFAPIAFIEIDSMKT